MARWVKCPLPKHENLSWIPSRHVKSNNKNMGHGGVCLESREARFLELVVSRPPLFDKFHVNDVPKVRHITHKVHTPKSGGGGGEWRAPGAG